MTEEVSGIVVALGEDGVQRITIDRAEVGNSLSPLARDALTEAFLHADSDPAVRAVLLSAAGTRHFCAGAGPGPRPAGTNRNRRRKNVQGTSRECCSTDGSARGLGPGL